MRIIIVKRITALMRFTGRETDAQKQTAWNEQNVNFCSGWRIGLEIKWSIWYNKNTEKKHCTQVIGTPVRAPDVRRCQRARGNQCGCQR